VDRILYVVTEDWYFWSHRLPIARAAKSNGYDVWVVAREGSHADQIRDEGFTFIGWDLKRGSANPWHEVRSLVELCRIYGCARPTIVHHVAIKPVLYGAIAAWIMRVPHVVNALMGLGFVFSSHWKASFIRPFVRRLFYLLLNRSNSLLIIQNRDDAHLFVHEVGVAAERLKLVRGSGVDVRHYLPFPEPSGLITFALVGRMLKDKGIYEFVEAVRKLRKENISFRACLVGRPDPENPSSIDLKVLEGWQKSGVIEWMGHRDDIATVWRKSHVAVLPSYREGLPKSLLEAAACGRPLIATDVPGCREIVIDNVNGILIAPHSSEMLAHAMKRMIVNKPLRQSMGKGSRKLAEEEFSDRVVVEQIMALYQSQLVLRRA